MKNADALLYMELLVGEYVKFHELRSILESWNIDAATRWRLRTAIAELEEQRHHVPEQESMTARPSFSGFEDADVIPIVGRRLRVGV